MKKKSIIMSVLLLMLAVGMSSCSSDDENVFSPVFGEVNVLLIRSDNGKISTGTMFKNGETYNPPHCYIGKGIDYNDKYPTTFYHMGFGTNIKGSDVFDMLTITIKSNQPLSFSNLKAGDTFDSSQFHAAAAYTQTWTEAVLKQTTALSGKVTVVGRKTVFDKSYIILRLTNLRFNAIDHTCVYTVNGTVEYEIWDIHKQK
jgi:hypothetical protein